MAPLKVIGAGYGRTGTASLRAALDMLGYKTHHMMAMLTDPDQDPEDFLKAYRHPDKPVDWDKVYKDYDAAVDWPTVSFWERLMNYYPESKIILTVRSAESWYDSAIKTIFRPENTDAVPEDWPEHRRRCFYMSKEIALDGDIGGREALKDKEAICKKFNEHIEYVKKTVPPDRLLVMNLGDGWEPLCKFLGKEVPNVPYPKSNSVEEFFKLDMHDPNLGLSKK